MSKYITLIYRNLERLIEEKNSSGRKISDIVGMSSSWMSDLKNAKSIKFELLEKISNYYNIPFSYFFQEDTEQYDNNNDLDLVSEDEASSHYIGKDEIKDLINTNRELTESVNALMKKINDLLSKNNNPTKATKDK